MKRPLFQYGLWPLAELSPWGDESNPTMPWVALPDGWYTVVCGDVELMRYSDEWLASLDQTHSTFPFVCYGVFRLADDLLSIAANVLYPIPQPLLRWIDSADREREFTPRADNWMQANADHPNLWTHWYHMMEWWSLGRSLMTGYVRGLPEVRVWSDGKLTHIRWQASRDVDPQSGLPLFAVEVGEFSLPTAEFHAELRAFHAEFMSQMRARITLAPNVFPTLLDNAAKQALIDDQTWREAGLQRALAWEPHMGRDWSRTIAVVEELMQ